MVRQREKHDWARNAALVSIFAIAVLLAGCTREQPAYVIDPDRSAPTYGERYATAYEEPYTDEHRITVHEGDSLSLIAARCGSNVGAIMRLNDLDDARAIYPGESLRVPSENCTEWSDIPRPEPRPHHDWVAGDDTPRVYPRPRPDRYETPARDERAAADNSDWEQTMWSWWTNSNTDRDTDSSSRFMWPVHGPIIEGFGRSRRGERNDGINIATEDGTPIRAAASGVVTYTGNELRDYGNLVLIKHDGGYVTAYAHAGSIRVHRGEHVEKGEVIATAGESGDVDRPQLHFEIRRGVQPVDPAHFLADRAS